MEYLHHGDLQNYLQHALPEPEARQIAVQLTEGLVLLHQNRFVHRDLKPTNIMVYRPGPYWWVKICDFGISKRIGAETALRTAIGTTGFKAPELDHHYPGGKPESSESGTTFTPAVDIWSLGAITHFMITFRSAFPPGPALQSYVVRGTAFPIVHLNASGASGPCRDFIQ